MQTTHTQKNIVVKIAIDDIKTFRGKKTGKVKCRLTDIGYEIVADSREALAEMVHAFFERASQSTDVSGTDEPPACLPDGKHADFVSWVHFQRKYREAIELGKTDHEAHAYACGY